METRNIFAIAYLFGAVWLLAWEFAAFAVNTKYTISDLWWVIEGKGWTFARYLTFCILTWLDLHLTYRWFR